MPDDDNGNDKEPLLSDTTRIAGVARGDGAGAALDTAHSLLANERRRHLLAILVHRRDETVEVWELVDAVAERERPEPGPVPHRDRVAIDLHHVHLPKLADEGVIDYDPAAGTVRYEDSETLASLLATTDELSEQDR